jgi:hypothetical protein
MLLHLLPFAKHRPNSSHITLYADRLCILPFHLAFRVNYLWFALPEKNSFTIIAFIIALFCKHFNQYKQFIQRISANHQFSVIYPPFFLYTSLFSGDNKSRRKRGAGTLIAPDVNYLLLLFLFLEG